MTMLPGKRRIRFFRILTATLLGAGLTATCGAAAIAIAGNLITVTAPAKEQFFVGTPVSVPISAADSAPGSTLAFSAVGLPAGLRINPSTGIISGTPTALGEDSATITVTDGTGSAGSARMISAVGGAISISRPVAPATGLGQPADLPFTVHDSASGDHVSYTVEGAPAGVGWDQKSTRIYGWPLVAGAYHVTVRAAGEDGGHAATSFTWTVRPASGTGPAGPVRLGADDKCLNDAGDKSANGTRIEIWTCDGKAQQRWTFAEDGSLRIHGKCLEIGGNGAQGSAIRLWTCTGATNERWTVQSFTTGVNHIHLASQASGLCLWDPDGFGRANGVQLEVLKCGVDDLPVESWTLPAGPILSGIPGRCLDDYRGVKKSGAEVDLAPCNGSAAQDWTYAPDETIRVFGLCLTRNTADGTSGSHVTLRNCTRARNQVWVVGGVTGFDNGGGVGFGNGLDSLSSLPLAAPAVLSTSPALAVMSNSGGPGLYWHIW